MRTGIHMRELSLLLTLCACGSSPKFPGTYEIVGFAKAGTRQAGAVPSEFRGMTLVLRDDGSATMHIVGSEAGEGEYTVDPREQTARISSNNGGAFLARFSHDTLVTRVPGGGPAFYWGRSK